MDWATGGGVVARDVRRVGGRVDGGERPRGRDVGPRGCGRGAPCRAAVDARAGGRSGCAGEGVDGGGANGAFDAGRPRAGPDGAAGRMAWRCVRDRIARRRRNGGQGRGHREGGWPVCPIRRGADGCRFGAGARRDVRIGPGDLVAPPCSGTGLGRRHGVPCV